MSRITFDIPQAKHPFIGLGDGIIICENGKEEPKIIIRFPLRGIDVVTATGEEAKAIILKLNETESYYGNDRLEYAKNAACNAVGIDTFWLHAKGKEEKGVFARWLVWDYTKNNMGMTLQECGNIFWHDHSTVLSALTHFSTEGLPFLIGWQKEAYEDYWASMREYMK